LLLLFLDRTFCSVEVSSPGHRLRPPASYLLVPPCRPHSTTITTILLNCNPYTGYAAIENEGNCRFRDLVRTRSAEYLSAYRRHTKDSIAREVVDTIKQRNGRFLTLLEGIRRIEGLTIDTQSRVWVEADDDVVLIKTKQALRDHTSESKGTSPKRRRSAVGSKNVVLEWITAPSNSTMVASSGAVNNTTNPTLPFMATATPGMTIPQQPLLPVQQPIFITNPTPFNIEVVRTPLTGAMSGPSPDALRAIVAAHQAGQYGLIPYDFLSTVSPSDDQLNMQPLIVSNQDPSHTIGASAVLGNAVIQGPSNTMQRYPASRFAERPSTTVSTTDRTLRSPDRNSLSHMTDLLLLHERGIGVHQGGSQAVAAVDNYMRSRAAYYGTNSPGISVDNFELCLLKVLCSLGIPFVPNVAATVGAVGGISAVGDSRTNNRTIVLWQRVWQHYQLESQSPMNTGALANNPIESCPAMARKATYLLSRCLHSATSEPPANILPLAIAEWEQGKSPLYQDSQMP
jgi:hypothetical protein